MSLSHSQVLHKMADNQDKGLHLTYGLIIKSNNGLHNSEIAFSNQIANVLHGNRYSFKPKNLIVGSSKVSCVSGITEAPFSGTKLYSPNPTRPKNGYISVHNWDPNNDHHVDMLSTGWLYTDFEEAGKRGKAMSEVTYED